ncbi:GAF domain-containing sensor histidine kinase [Promicromonospora sp. NPDC090134]|uniref:GAF domain-containing sensor histidine kinase n=1 Tax=Promicromonospora sp. NPDC090134 TaxID=3364408 RepID=UPI0037F1235A
MHARIAWGVLALTTLAGVLDTAFTAAHRSLLSEATWADHGWPLTPLAGVGCALMGALIVSRYPRQPLGWLLCTASLLSVTLAADAYSIWVLEGDGPGSPYWAHVAAWASPLLGWPAFTALIMVFLISPDGRLASPRWRWAVWVTVVGLGLHTLGTLTIRPGESVYGEDYGNRTVSGPLLTTGSLLVAAGLIASAVSLALRLRRAADDERRQLLWIASSAVFLAFGVVVVLLVPLVQGQEGTWLAGLPLRLAQLAVPLCVAVAVLRHRLLQIDLIVNRALVFALATGLVAVGYVLVVVLIGLTIGGSTGGFWPSLLATALVAIAFQPLRRRVVRVADRLAFGAAAAPYEALADFSRRVGDTPDPSDLLPTVADAAAHAVKASRVIVVLHIESAPDRTAVWPPSGTDDPTASDIEMPVVDRGERLGSIMVQMPAGHPLRPREQRLMADLADQAAMAFRNARLTAELSAEVEQVGVRTRELTESRRRLISADDAERSRLERTIARQVVPHLTPLPSRLRQLSSLDHNAPNTLDAAVLGELVESLNLALAALREITRGVFPAQLARSGLPTALASLLARTSSSARLVVEPSVVGRRFDPRVEAATYFCVAEAIPDLGDPVVVLLEAHDDQLRLVVRGRDRGGLPLRHMQDRVEAAGGSVRITEQDGHTVIEVRGPTPVARVVSSTPTR